MRSSSWVSQGIALANPPEAALLEGYYLCLINSVSCADHACGIYRYVRRLRLAHM